MAYLVWPDTPAVANYDRQPNWATEGQRYETGASQFSTTYIRPLYDYSLTYGNVNDSKRQTIEDFWNDCKGGTLPFLWVDPKTEHHYVNSANTFFNANSRQGRCYTSTDSWRVIPASGAFSLFTALSGDLTLGLHYSYSQDNGVFEVFTTALNSSDTYRWGGTFYRKVHFERGFKPRSRVWGIYGFTIGFYEVLP